MNWCEPFAEVARAIADDAVRSARAADDGVCWQTTAMRGDRVPQWVFSSSLYNGAAGIALFLLEAAGVLREPSYRQTALAGLRWAGRNVDAAAGGHSFYGGRLGISYAMLRAHEITGGGEWLEGALRAAHGHREFLESCRADDLLNGAAGTALGFLHLHAATGEAWTAQAAEQFLHRLVRAARWTPIGVTWCAEEENIRGLCGLSHGNAGIAFVLLEAARYFGQDGLAALAREAIRYENAWFDPATRSWPDFRKLGRFDDERFAREYGDQPEEFFLRPGGYDTWCHGAPGIGLARARALEILGSEFDDDLRHALERTERANVALAQASFTLCHGVCGNGFLFLEAARVLGEARWLAMAEEVGQRAMAHRERWGRFLSGFPQNPEREDLGLMLGDAGIGYFFLNLIEPALPNPLLPSVMRGGAASADSWSEPAVMRRLLSAQMPGTMALLDREPDTFLGTWRERGDALSFIATRAAAFEGGRAIADLELAKIRMYDEWPSFALARFQKWRVRRDAPTAGDLDGRAFRLAPYTRFWRDGERSHLLRIDGANVVADSLTPLADAVLACFEEPRTMDDAVRAVSSGLGDGVPQEAIRDVVEEQVRAALAAALLQATAGRLDDGPP